MRFQEWKRLSARRRAIWPGDMKAYLHPQKKITLSIDSALAEWLIDEVVGRSSFTADLEETVATALRVMRGELPTTYFPRRPGTEPDVSRPQSPAIRRSKASRKSGS